ncbi:MAG: hypothetical protein KDL87_06650, partial [Verrucomicrobiae bacterium]|nr:hypothetical protein [Verrucomicrobiae bacterium]
KINAVVGAFNQRVGTQIIPGRLPLPGDGKVDLSMFAQYLSNSKFTPVPPTEEPPAGAPAPNAAAPGAAPTPPAPTPAPQPK